MARQVLVACVAAVVVAAGCKHAERVGDSGGSGEAERSKAEPSKKETRVPPRGGRPAVAADPAGLMRPGSAKKIEEALQSKGYLQESSDKANANELTADAAAALRKFQRDEGLAETGAPDRETLRRLGVDPQDVYSTGRQGTGSQ